MNENAECVRPLSARTAMRRHRQELVYNRTYAQAVEFAQPVYSALN
jgi:hypothetical protein